MAQLSLDRIGSAHRIMKPIAIAATLVVLLLADKTWAVDKPIALTCEGTVTDSSKPGQMSELVKGKRVDFSSDVVSLDQWIADVRSHDEHYITFHSESGVGEIDGSIDRITGKVIFSVKSQVVDKRWNLTCALAKPIF